MSTQIVNYNTDITSEEFFDEFCRKGHILYDKRERVLGSVSGKGIFDLNGSQVAALVEKDTAVDENGDKERVAVYASDTRRFRLVNDRLYSVTEQGEEWLGRVARTERNKVHIILLSILAFFLTATVILIALIGLPIADTPKEPVDPDTLVPEINISDSNGTWDDGTTIGMFGSSVLPGSEDKYEFVIRNPHDTTLEYDFWIEPVYEGELDIEYFPILFRIKMNNLVVEPGNWRKVNELRLEDMQLSSLSTHTFTLEWQWAFESGNDHYDTLLGEDNGNISLVLHFTAQTVKDKAL